jgi:hypothetical protein
VTLEDIGDTCIFTYFVPAPVQKITNAHASSRFCDNRFWKNESCATIVSMDCEFDRPFFSPRRRGFARRQLTQITRLTWPSLANEPGKTFFAQGVAITH